MFARLLALWLGAVLATVGVGLWVLAALRPYADNQRNWLFLFGAGFIGVAALVILGGLPWAKVRLKAGALRLASEWRPRHRSG